MCVWDRVEVDTPSFGEGVTVEIEVRGVSDTKGEETGFVHGGKRTERRGGRRGRRG